MQMTVAKTARALGVAASLLALGACGGDDTGPSSQQVTLSMAETKSGNAQTGVVQNELASDLRVVVTRDGNPVGDVEVTWSTDFGTVAPVTDRTDEEGVSTTRWTLGSVVGAQTAFALVAGASGSPVKFDATAIEDNGGPPIPP